MLILISLLSFSAHADVAPDPALIKRGEYLVKVVGCADCHVTKKMGPNGPEPDFSRGYSGHPANLVMPAAPASDAAWMWHGSATMTAYAGPWGVSFAANLTPDKNTGIGNWTEQNFIDTLRTGRVLGIGRPLLPPMPWQALANATDEDLKAMYAYFMAQPAVQNRVPDPVDPR